MARALNGSATLIASGHARASYPLSYSGWFQVTSIGATVQALISQSTITDQYVRVYEFSGALRLQRAGTASEAISAASITTNTWFHVGVVVTAANSCAVYLNGAKTTNSATDTVNFATATPVTTVGYYQGGSTLFKTTGKAAEVAIYNAALTDEDMVALAAGHSPLMVRPEALASHWPLHARATDEEDWVGALTLVNTSATAADHPPIVYPARQGLVQPAAGSPTTIAGTVGNAAADGSTASVYQGSSIAGAVGNAAANGSSAAVYQGTNVAAAAGNAVADGSTSSVYQGAIVAAAVGNAVANGSSAAVYQGAIVSAGVGNATAAGATATVTNSADVTVAGAVGNAVAAGSSAAIYVGNLLSASRGDAVANGLTASITAGLAVSATDIDLTVALDGSKRRNLVLIPGMTYRINLEVFERDGDDEPLTVDGAYLTSDAANYRARDMGEVFTAVEDYEPRFDFTIVGEIDGVRMTLVVGSISTPSLLAATRVDASRNDYGGWQ